MFNCVDQVQDVTQAIKDSGETFPTAVQQTLKAQVHCKITIHVENAWKAFTNCLLQALTGQSSPIWVKASAGLIAHCWPLATELGILYSCGSPSQLLQVL